MKGKGIRKVNGFGYGDHYIHIKIKIPTRLRKEQEELIRAFAELEENTPGTIAGVHTDKNKSGKSSIFSDLKDKWSAFMGKWVLIYELDSENVNLKREI